MTVITDVRVRISDVFYTLMLTSVIVNVGFFFFQAEDGIRDLTVTGVQTCALPIFRNQSASKRRLGIAKGCINRFPAGLINPDRKSTRLNSSHSQISYAVFCLKKKKDRTSW